MLLGAAAAVCSCAALRSCTWWRALCTCGVCCACVCLCVHCGLRRPCGVQARQRRSAGPADARNEPISCAIPARGLYC